MIAPVWAALIASVALAAGDYCNRRVVGWLPDDPPQPGRKQHAQPIPLAGVLLLPAIAPWCIARAAWLPLGALLLAAAVGFVDDWRKERGDGLDWRLKGLGLAIASAAVATSTVPIATQPLQWALAFGLVFVLTNATNFLDNTDGVSASLSAVALLVLSHAIEGTTWIAAAGFAAIGFLPWNWPRAQLFLGDSGAYTLGLATGYATLHAIQLDLTWLLATTVQLVDFVQVVAARLIIGVAPWIADRRHLTHIVHNLGMPRWAIAPLFAATAVAIAALPCPVLNHFW